jgi:hypothetical protein
MVLWMTRDAFWASVLGVAIVVWFVGYNSVRSFRRRYRVERRDRPGDSTKWN